MDRQPRKIGDAIFEIRRQHPKFQDVKVCNCASCVAELAHKPDARYFGLQVLFGRIDGRPYCEACFKQRQVAQEKADRDAARRDRRGQRDPAAKGARLDSVRLGRAADPLSVMDEPAGEGTFYSDSQDIR